MSNTEEPGETLADDRFRVYMRRSKADLVGDLMAKELRVTEMLNGLHDIGVQVSELSKRMPALREELNQSRQWGQEVQGRFYDEQNAHAETKRLLAAAEAEAVELAGEKRALLKALVAATVD